MTEEHPYIEGLKHTAESLVALRPGWDGEGGIVPYAAAITSAINFVKNLPERAKKNGIKLPKQQPSLVLYGKGVAFSWHTETARLTFDINPDGSYGKFCMVKYNVDTDPISDDEVTICTTDTRCVGNVDDDLIFLAATSYMERVERNEEVYDD